MAHSGETPPEAAMRAAVAVLWDLQATWPETAQRALAHRILQRERAAPAPPPAAGTWAHPMASRARWHSPVVQR
eukprot:9537595-Prorocentrum_lima.AAC.1